MCGASTRRRSSRRSLYSIQRTLALSHHI
uniref:Uncharacterized protein n=1 Tax=Anguilla anguilla TaxID=7936 RepID=A0A0E9V1V2_ANGAN